MVNVLWKTYIETSIKGKSSIDDSWQLLDQTRDFQPVRRTVVRRVIVILGRLLMHQKSDASKKFASSVSVLFINLFVYLSIYFKNSALVSSFGTFLHCIQAYFFLQFAQQTCLWCSCLLQPGGKLYNMIQGNKKYRILKYKSVLLANRTLFESMMKS